MITLVLALLVNAAPVGAEEHLEAALRCQRRGDLECAAREAAQAIDGPDAAITRDALVVLAPALARTNKPAEAKQAFERLLTVYPQWRPPPDADATVKTAFDDARRGMITQRLPVTLDPGPPPDVPRPSGDEIVKLLPQPRLYSPPVDTDPPTLSLSIGAGVGVPVSDRVGLGLNAALDLRYLATEQVSIWAQGAFALLPLDDDLPVEPGQARGLTVFGVTVGVELSIPLDGAFSTTLAVGVGYGGFGYREATEASGLALAGVLGVRWQADKNLAVRLDAAPLAIVPFGTDIGMGGHFAALLRGETRF